MSHDLSCGCPACDKRAVSQAEQIAADTEAGSRVVDYMAALFRAQTLRKLEERVRRVNLQELGFRYIYRPSQHPDCGIWIRPEFIQPEDTDCTDMTDDEFEDMLTQEQQHREFPW